MKKKVVQKAPSNKKKEGRIPIPIDWKKVDEWLEAGCKGTEVAAMLGVSDDTLYGRCFKEKETIFSTYSAKKLRTGAARGDIYK